MKPDLDLKDVQIILSCHKFQKEYGSITQIELSRRLNMSLSTIERRMNKYRAKGYMISIRKGSKLYEYNFTDSCPLHLKSGLSDPSHSPNLCNKSQCDPSKSMKSFNTEKPRELLKPLKLLNLSQLNATGGCSFAEQKKDSASFPDPDSFPKAPMYPMYSYERFNVFDSMFIEKEENRVPIVFLGRGELKEELEKVFKDRKPIVRKKEAAIENTKKESEFITTRADLHEEKRIPNKKISCNSSDVWYVFLEEWNKEGWRSKPSEWTRREQKHIKDLIKEYGFEETCEYIRYCFQNWSDFISRYKLSGCFPTVPIIYGFRASWFPESVDKIKPENALPKIRKEREYRPKAEGSDIPSGSWGEGGYSPQPDKESSVVQRKWDYEDGKDIPSGSWGS